MLRCARAALVIVLAVPLCADAGGAGGGLSAALKKFATADSYAFTVKEGAGAASVLEAKYQKGRPLYGKVGKIELYRQGVAIAYNEGTKWEKSRIGTLSDPLRVLGAVARVRKARLPHDELAHLAKALKDVKRAKAGGQTVYTGTLTLEAAQRLAPIEFKDLARSGTIKLTLAPDGTLTGYRLAIHVQGRLGNAEVDGTQERTVTLRGLGVTKVEVPAAARKALP